MSCIYPVSSALPAAMRERLARQFAAEPAYAHIGLVLTDLARGFCRSATPVRPALLHHRGALQGGLLAMIADSTAGYAALATLDDEAAADDMATVEFRTAFYRPLVGALALCRARATFVARGMVFCQAEVFAEREEPERLCGEANLTFRRLRGRSGA
ncbi:MAG: PaaI family thioesterase [Methylobacteriaceae bacterium]|nr:PaaI family thioesterase [Methylobacteriaceae bacterium]